MSSLILSRRDLDFLLYEWLQVEALTARPRFSEHSRETFDAALDLCEAIATDHFAPHSKAADAQEPRFENGRVVMIPQVKQALAVFRDAGLFAAAADFEHGGMQLPLTVSSAGFAYFQAANCGTAAYPFLTLGAAHLLQAHGSSEQIGTYVRPMLEGRWYGTMALSEPQAGSSLADITTRAEPRADGTYRLFGTKMWISGGDHELTDNIVQMVLAKIPGGPAGVGGISLFVVPKFLVRADGSLGERNDVVLAGLNHKMGYRGTTNTLLNLGEGAAHRPGGEAGAVGYLVGQPHRGLAYMFHMMNEARIGVGRGAAALGYTGYLHALDYARNRPQGRAVGDKSRSKPQVRIVEHADVRRMLLAQKAYVEGGMALVLYCARLVDEEMNGETPESAAEAKALLDLLTPIAKSWPSQWCLAANDLAIQVHGGYGYTRDYNVEQFYRDNRLNPIHEGTHGVQGLDLLGRKVAIDGGRGAAVLRGRMADAIARARACGDAALGGFADGLAAMAEELWRVTAVLHGAGDPSLTLANATVYLEAFGHVVVAWLWLDQALTAHGRSGDFYDGKRQACRFFFDWELPKVAPQLALLASLDRTPLDMRDAWF